jgi:hypothetical protein
MATFTLHQGDAEQTFVEHPTETARRALVAAADVETAWLAEELRRLAWALPNRAAMPCRHQVERGDD